MTGDAGRKRIARPVRLIDEIRVGRRDPVGKCRDDDHEDQHARADRRDAMLAEAFPNGILGFAEFGIGGGAGGR
ncbi:MAG: hypothetical protein NVS2B17_00840 [Candidatus Velthaea sp.]